MITKMVTKIISGGQFGADQGGLDAALHLGLEVGGWIPRGRRTHLGRLCDKLFVQYNLKEHSSRKYPPRTEQNVLDSDGTAIFGDLSSTGSKLTIDLCRKHNKSYIENPDKKELRLWIIRNHIKCLNVAGNRESVNPGIHDRVFNILVAALLSFKEVEHK